MRVDSVMNLDQDRKPCVNNWAYRVVERGFMVGDLVGRL
jgi:hypothetical protein